MSRRTLGSRRCLDNGAWIETREFTMAYLEPSIPIFQDNESPRKATKFYRARRLITTNEHLDSKSPKKSMKSNIHVFHSPDHPPKPLNHVTSSNFQSRLSNIHNHSSQHAREPIQSTEKKRQRSQPIDRDVSAPPDAPETRS